MLLSLSNFEGPNTLCCITKGASGYVEEGALMVMLNQSVILHILSSLRNQSFEVLCSAAIHSLVNRQIPPSTTHQALLSPLSTSHQRYDFWYLALAPGPPNFFGSHRLLSATNNVRSY